MADDDAVVRITLRDVYAVVERTASDVAEIKAHASSQVEKVNDHENRLRAVERKVWQLPSIATVVAVVAAAASALGVIHSYAH